MIFIDSCFNEANDAKLMSLDDLKDPIVGVHVSEPHAIPTQNFDHSHENI